MDREREFRKQQNALMIAGQGFILFSAWSVIKLFLYLTVEKKFVLDIIGDLDDDRLTVTFAFAILSVIFLLDALIHFIIGKSAMDIARGGRLKKLYIPFIAIYTVATMVVFYFNADTAFAIQDTEDVSALALEIMSIVLLIAILVSSYKIYKYRKENASHSGRE